MILLVQAASTFFMIGVIWFVQIVHYPLMNRIGPDQFIEYHRMHSRLTSLVVVPVMIAELFSALLFIWFRPDRVPEYLALVGMVPLAVIWLSTFFVQVPRHGMLADHFTPVAHRSLVKTNWIRTAAWTLRGCIVIWMLHAT